MRKKLYKFKRNVVGVCIGVVVGDVVVGVGVGVGDVVVVVGGGGGGGRCRYDGWCTKYVVVLVVHIVGYFVVVCGLPGS